MAASEFNTFFAVSVLLPHVCWPSFC